MAETFDPATVAERIKRALFGTHEGQVDLPACTAWLERWVAARAGRFTAHPIDGEEGRAFLATLRSHREDLAEFARRRGSQKIEPEDLESLEALIVAEQATVAQAGAA